MKYSGGIEWRGLRARWNLQGTWVDRHCGPIIRNIPPPSADSYLQSDLLWKREKWWKK